MGPERKSGRKQKRPSFFQEFEEEEDNLDKILDDFELEQIEEAKNPDAKPKPKPKNPDAPKRPRKRKEPSPGREDDEEIELETSRSGRVRKKTKFYDYFNKEGGEEVSGSDESEDDDFNPEVEGEEEEPEEEFDPLSPRGSGSEGEGGAGGDLALPPKKRKARPIDQKDGVPTLNEENIDTNNASKLSHEKTSRLNSDGEEVFEEEEFVSGELKLSTEKNKEASETAKEAKEHGLSDEKQVETEKESNKTNLEEATLQTPRPEAPSEGKEENINEDDNAGGLDGSVTEETPNDENPL